MTQRSRTKSSVSLWKVLGVLFALGLSLSLVVPLFMQVRARLEAERRARLEQAFAGSMPAYTGRFRPAARPTVPTGKILIVDPVEGKIDPLFYEIERTSQAQTPDEVGVLVWMNCRVLDTFTYFGTVPLVVDWEACVVTVIDWPSKTVVAQREFTGQQPPGSVSVDADGHLSAADSRRLDAAKVNHEGVREWIRSQIERDNR